VSRRQSRVRGGIRSSILLAGLVLFAAGKAEAYQKRGGGDNAADVTFERRARMATGAVLAGVQELADKVDLMIAGRRYVDQLNNTRVNLSQLITWKEGGEVDKSTDLGVNLRLPNTEKRWQARFSTYDEEAEERDMQQRRVRTTPRPRDPGASLFFLRRLGDIDVTFQPKLQLKNPLDMSYVLKLSSPANYKKVHVTPEMQLFVDAQNGAGEYFALNFEGPLGPRTEWHFENEEEYHEFNHQFSTRHGVATDYGLSDRQALGAAFVAQSLNHNFHLDSLNLSGSYAEEIYKDLLRYMISPFIGFASADNFKGKVGITLTVTVIF
jgi:hypothetical protein